MIEKKLMADDETENMVRAAWYYFIAGLNQSEIADRLGLSRIKVNRLIAEARAGGHVVIRITHPSARILDLEAGLASRWGLTYCRVVPALGGDHPETEEEDVANRRCVAIAAADLLANEVSRKPDGIFGVGWGTTIADMVSQYHGPTAPDARFVSIMGSLTRNAAANPFESVHWLAQKSGAEGYFLPAPYLADTISDQQVFMAQRTVSNTLALAAKADLCIVGVTAVDDLSFIRAQKLLTKDELDEARAAGAVGSCTGLFFDAQGEQIPCGVNERRIGLDIPTLKALRVVGAVSGVDKQAAVRAALKGKFFTGLVVDENLARALL